MRCFGELSLKTYIEIVFGKLVMEVLNPNLGTLLVVPVGCIRTMQAAGNGSVDQLVSVGRLPSPRVTRPSVGCCSGQLQA